MRFREWLAVLATLVMLAAGISEGMAPMVAPELLQRAIESGSVRLIVRLKVDEGANAGEIANAKQALLSELTGTRYRVERDLVGLPTLALEASAETLRILAASPRVERVTEDRPRRPQR
jgi:hypothetical protein